jgi:dTMP kinase
MGRGLDRADLEWMNRFATGGLKPDLTLLYDLSPAEGLRRASSAKNHTADRMENSGPAFHGRVRRGFLALALEEPKRVRVIPVGGRTPQEIFETSLGHLRPRLLAKGYGV